MSEHDEQVALFQWAAWCVNVVPELALMFAIPNGGKRSIGTARKLKAEGVKAGVPDIFLPVARHGYNGLFIEMKSKGGKCSAEQKRFQDAVSYVGYLCAVCYSADEAAKFIDGYLTKAALPASS